MLSFKRGLKCIGICPWGYIHNNKALINKDMAEFHAARLIFYNWLQSSFKYLAIYSLFTISRYNSNIEIKSKHPVPLNPDHTHFLMVDDGYRSSTALCSHQLD